MERGAEEVEDAEVVRSVVRASCVSGASLPFDRPRPKAAPASDVTGAVFAVLGKNFVWYWARLSSGLIAGYGTDKLAHSRAFLGSKFSEQKSRVSSYSAALVL